MRAVRCLDDFIYDVLVSFNTLLEMRTQGGRPRESRSYVDFQYSIRDAVVDVGMTPSIVPDVFQYSIRDASVLTISSSCMSLALPFNTLLEMRSQSKTSVCSGWFTTFQYSIRDA